jgi:hypothetical protein
MGRTEADVPFFVPLNKQLDKMQKPTIALQAVPDTV